jgi:hypothetical protein
MTDKLKEVSQFCEKHELIAEINKLKTNSVPVEAIEGLIRDDGFIEGFGSEGVVYISDLKSLIEDTKG